jgi:predicted phage terminase large subunit-like protein
MLSKFEAVARGKIAKLALRLPPNSAKSTYGSIIFPAWYLGNNPTKSIIACSHTQTLADKFGRKVRNLFSRAEHQRLFNVGIAKDSQAVGNWATDQDGEYFAAGVGAAITGRRGDIGLIDDPVRGFDAAYSPTNQEAVWDWYVSEFCTRLNPNAAQILIMTPWNDNDLGAKIFEREKAEWDVVELPMEAVENDPIGRALGERLWPEYNTDEMVATAKKDPRLWNAAYQQSPVRTEGDYFKLSYFATEYATIPDNAHYYGASDFAVTKDGGDWTEHGVFALDAFGNIYVVDWWRGQTTSDVWIERLCDLVQEYEPLAWFGESGPIRRSIEPYMAQRMTERNANVRLEWLPSIGSKALRVRAFQALSSRGKVFMPKLSAWKANLIYQLTAFDAGRTDDGVDVCSLLGRGLDLVNAPKMRRWTQAQPTRANADAGEHAWMAG